MRWCVGEAEQGGGGVQAGVKLHCPTKKKKAHYSYLMQIGPVARESVRVTHVNAAREYYCGTIIQCLHVSEE